MIKLCFKRTKIRIFVLVAVFSLLVFLFIAEKSIQLTNNSSVIQNEKDDLSNHLPGTNSDKKILESHIVAVSAKESVLHKISSGLPTSLSFKPALARPESYKPDGLGELGIEVVLTNLTKEEELEQNELRADYGINQFLSQKISLHRTLKDPRPPE